MLGRRLTDHGEQRRLVDIDGEPGRDAERLLQLVERRRKRTICVGPRQRQRAASRGEEREAFVGREAPRSGEQARDSDLDPAIFDVEVDELVGIGRQPAQGGELEVADEIVGADPEPLRDIVDTRARPCAMSQGNTTRRRRRRSGVGRGPRRPVLLMSHSLSHGPEPRAR